MQVLQQPFVASPFLFEDSSQVLDSPLSACADDLEEPSRPICLFDHLAQLCEQDEHDVLLREDVMLSRLEVRDKTF